MIVSLLVVKGHKTGKRRKKFFFEKKNQKTFDIMGASLKQRATA
jgi:hypothetical protein